MAIDIPTASKRKDSRWSGNIKGFTEQANLHRSFPLLSKSTACFRDILACIQKIVICTGTNEIFAGEIVVCTGTIVICTGTNEIFTGTIVVCTGINEICTSTNDVCTVQMKFAPVHMTFEPVQITFSPVQMIFSPEAVICAARRQENKKTGNRGRSLGFLSRA